MMEYTLNALVSGSTYADAHYLYSAIWAVSLITCMAAVNLDALKPVGRNWCDLDTTESGLRYALVDGWRLAIMILTICLYSFIWCIIRQHGTLLAI